MFEKYRVNTEYLDNPLNISRYLVNSFVGDNYKYLDWFYFSKRVKYCIIKIEDRRMLNEENLYRYWIRYR